MQGRESGLMNSLTPTFKVNISQSYNDERLTSEDQMHLLVVRQTSYLHHKLANTNQAF